MFNNRITSIKKLLILLCIMGCSILPTSSIFASYVSEPGGIELKAQPEDDSESIASIPYGKEVETIVFDNKWARVIYDNTIAYTKRGYISEEDPMNGMQYLGNWDITAYAETGYPCANGNYPSVGYTIACNSLPFGTHVYIDGVGERVVEDRGAASHGGNWCDLYLGNYEDCINWGNQYRDVYIIQ